MSGHFEAWQIYVWPCEGMYRVHRVHEIRVYSVSSSQGLGCEGLESTDSGSYKELSATKRLPPPNTWSFSAADECRGLRSGVQLEASTCGSYQPKCMTRFCSMRLMRLHLVC